MACIRHRDVDLRENQQMSAVHTTKKGFKRPSERGAKLKFTIDKEDPPSKRCAILKRPQSPFFQLVSSNTFKIGDTCIDVLGLCGRPRTHSEDPPATDSLPLFLVSLQKCPAKPEEQSHSVFCKQTSAMGCPARAYGTRTRLWSPCDRCPDPAWSTKRKKLKESPTSSHKTRSMPTSRYCPKA